MLPSTGIIIAPPIPKESGLQPSAGPCGAWLQVIVLSNDMHNMAPPHFSSGGARDFFAPYIGIIITLRSRRNQGSSGSAAAVANSSNR